MGKDSTEYSHPLRWTKLILRGCGPGKNVVIKSIQKTAMVDYLHAGDSPYWSFLLDFGSPSLEESAKLIFAHSTGTATLALVTLLAFDVTSTKEVSKIRRLRGQSQNRWKPGDYQATKENTQFRSASFAHWIFSFSSGKFSLEISCSRVRVLFLTAILQ